MLNMFSRTNMPSTTTVLSAYTSIATSTMIVRTIANEVQSLANQFIPQQLRGKIFEVLRRLYGNVASQFTLVVDEYDGLILNQKFEAAELYPRTKITPSIKKLRVSKIPTEKNLLVTVEKGQEIVDDFKGIQLTWKYSCTVTQSSSPDYEGSGSYTNTTEKKNFELSFHSKDKNSVLDSYLPYVLERSKAIKEENRRVKLYSLGFCGDGDGGGVWGSTNLDHPVTFNTVAMDPKLKSELLEDLDRFVRRRDFYRRVGKAWKRGYLPYGPPGTGKSSLIAAMANYLNFNIYDLELANLHSNSELRRLLVSTANRSILVIEDIDCTIELQDRSYLSRAQEESDLTLSGILNFIDGLWSSCGDERIIVFTTNHKDRLDPALLRPGRMDMHVHMSYCTPCGFKLLASNYLMIQNHSLFKEIEGLIKEVNITPAEVAEELMKSDDADISLKSLINLLQKKKTECDESNVEDGKEADQGSKRQKIENEHENQIKKKRRTKRAKY